MNGVFNFFLLSSIAVAFFSSWILTGLCALLLPRFGLIDTPRGRHTHRKPIPLAGGLAIGAAFFLSSVLYGFGAGLSAPEGSVLPTVGKLAVPLTFMLLVGLIDDRWELKSYIKLAAQLAVSAWACYNGMGIRMLFFQPLPEILAYVVTAIWFVGIINAFNLIDGLDGLAAGLAIIASLALTLFLYISGTYVTERQLLLLFAAACAGFLRHNFPPARIFMGDCGSMFIGTFFAIVGTEFYSKAATFTALIVPLMAIAIPLFDVFLAIWRRTIRKTLRHDASGEIMTGDHLHLHHRILQFFNGDQRKTTLALYLAAALISGVGIIWMATDSIWPSLGSILVAALLLLLLRMAFIEVVDSLDLLSRQVSRPAKKWLIIGFHVLLDFILISAAFEITWQIFGLNFKCDQHILAVFLAYLPFGLSFVLSGIYRTFWFRAGFRSYYLQLRCLVIGGMLSFCGFSLLLLCYPDLSRIPKLYAAYSFFILLMACMIMAERLLLRYFEYYAIRYYRLRFGNYTGNAEPQRALIYGGGVLCRCYLSLLFSGSRVPSRWIVGILDDMPNLRGMYLHGYRVLGGLRDLEEVYQEHPFDQIVVTIANPQNRLRERLEEFCRQRQVALSYFKLELQEAVPAPSQTAATPEEK